MSHYFHCNTCDRIVKSKRELVECPNCKSMDVMPLEEDEVDLDLVSKGNSKDENENIYSCQFYSKFYGCLR